MDSDLLETFGLDPSIVHLNHGAFGVAPRSVRSAAEAWREEAERNPHRFNRVEVAQLVVSARRRAAEFLDLSPADVGLVRNVSEGVSSVLGSLDLAPGEELVTSRHGYGAVRMALGHWARRRGAIVREAVFPVGATDQEIVEAYLSVCSSRTRLAVVDQITSPTASVLPVRAVAEAVDLPVLVDAAHVPGSLPTKVAELGATWWVGNLHKWAYTPRGTAVVWRAESAPATWPSVLSWQLEDGYAASFDYPGTWDYAAWLAVPDGLDFWAQVGGWEQVDKLGAMVAAGQRHVAETLGTSVAGLPDTTAAPTMRLVRLPDRMVEDPSDTQRLYERLSVEHRVETAPILVDGRGYLRVAAAPYNTLDDYERLADAVAFEAGRPT